jgi:hypothetical protein
MSIQLGEALSETDLHSWRDDLTDSERALVNACTTLAADHPAAALPARNLLNLLAKLAGKLDAAELHRE